MDSKNISALYENCIQCPRRCGANRAAGVRGFCGENLELRAAVSCLHFGEEPPLTVFGGSGAIFFTGCTLRCAFCQNYQISQQGFGGAISKSDFAKICLDLQDAGAENINLVTGSHHIPLLAQFIREAKSAGCALPFCWNSSAYENVESLEALKDCVDIWLPDFKTLDKDFSKKVFLAQDYPEVAKKSISWMIKNFPLKTKTVSKEGRGEKEKIFRGVIVRHLFLPGRFEDTANTLAWLKENADGKAMISLMSQYTPVSFKEKSEESLRRKAALAAFENRFVSQTEDGDLRDLIAAYDFENLFYQELNCNFNEIQDIFNKFDFCNKVTDLSSEDFYGLLLRIPTLENFSESVELSKALYRIMENSDFSKEFKISMNKNEFLKNGKILVKYQGSLKYYNAKESYLPTSKILDKKNFPIVEKGIRTNNQNFIKTFGCKEYSVDYKIIEKSISTSKADADFQSYFSEFKKYAHAYGERNDNIEKDNHKLKITLVNKISVLENGVEKEITDEYICIRDIGTNWFITIFGTDLEINKLSEIIENIYENIANARNFDAEK